MTAGQRARLNLLRRIRRLAGPAVGFAAILVGATVGWRAWNEANPPTADEAAKAAIESEFTLVDHRGRPVTYEDFLGRWQLFFFGFTHCPDICPTTLGTVAATLDQLGPAADRVAPLFITVDPERDTPEVLAEYVAAFHPRLIGLTGTPEQVRSAVRAFRIYFAKMEMADAPDGYLMGHSGYIYLMMPEGEFDSVYAEHRDTPDKIAHAIRERLKEHGR